MEWLNSEQSNLYINTNEQHKSKRIKELTAFIALIALIALIVYIALIKIKIKFR